MPLNSLLERYLPRLRRWASGRLPAYARDLGDTNDLIQEAAIGTFRNFPRFQQRGEGGLHAYLRTAVVDRIHDEVRRAGRRPALDEISTALPTPQTLAPRARDRAGGPRPLRARARAARRRRARGGDRADRAGLQLQEEWLPRSSASRAPVRHAWRSRARSTSWRA